MAQATVDETACTLVPVKALPPNYTNGYIFFITTHMQEKQQQNFPEECP